MPVKAVRVRRRSERNRKKKKDDKKREHVSVNRPGMKMVIAPEGSANGIVVPYAPREVTYQNLSAEWSEIQRTARSPLVVRSNEPQPRMSFSLFFSKQDPDVSIANQIRTLARYARSNKRLRVVYSSWERGLWRITSLSVESILRSSKNQEITRATVNIEFALASDVSRYVGPVSGGVQPPRGGDSKDKKKRKPRKHKVKKGDTLHSLAIKYYKNARKWKKIARANKIKNPRAKRALKVGRILRIP